MAMRVLVVDDDPSIREALTRALSEELELQTAPSAEAALSGFASFGPDVVLSDVRMPGMDGLALLRLLRERSPRVDVVMMSAFDDMPTVVAAMREGACDFLAKPLDLHDVRRVITRVLDDRRTRERSRLSRQDDAAPYQLDSLVGRDPAMVATYKLVGQAAAVRSNVLVRGETGTGKELIARAVHYNSADKNDPFVALNCTALPSTLLESELFGHVKGAFTGATGSRRGRFELAARGTIFLDEIGDTSAEFQTKLLRVLQEREYYPVGAERAERTEARVIAATHRNLEDMIAAGTFRADLYYRLRVLEITVPALRDRVADIPLLVHHLLRVTSNAMHRAPPVVSDAALALLAQYPWPGNVRELENCLTRALVLARGNVIRPEHVVLANSSSTSGALPTLDVIEGAHVERVMAAAGGNKSEAARILGVSRPRLDRLLAKHGLS
ncbi:MAG TPA: sigma-54 dependent transcriptional regulator [Gemmatimonadaceae bacterium]|nr:sigma-54 dependent transcriptional regulator [Gemmatimonadaceae bacterium]